MGHKLPVISGKEAAKAFERAGWNFDRRKGSHMIYVKPFVRVNLSIPDHKEIDPGLLRSLIRKSGLTVDEFIGLLR